MRFVNVRELKSKTSEILRAAAGENIVVTNRGKPVAVLQGFDSTEFERAAFRPAAGVRETRAPYGAAVKGQAFGSPLARGFYPRASTAEVDPLAKPGGPAAAEDLPLPSPKPGANLSWNPLKAVFWDYPELTDEAALGRKIQEARDSSLQDAFRWYLARCLERGRVVDTLRFFRLEEIRRVMPSLRISPRTAAKWARILAGYGNA
jgi:prevent-host-death family protein